MALTQPQRDHPQRSCWSTLLKTRMSYLERSFTEFQRKDEREAWWTLGNATTALTHPVRGPRLVQAFLAGTARRTTPLNEEERSTWMRLWNGLPTHPPALAHLGVVVLTMRAPDLAEVILAQETVSFHTPIEPQFPLLETRGKPRNGTHTVWTALLAQAGRLAMEMRWKPEAKDLAERIEHQLEQMERGWDEAGWSMDERNRALALLTEVGAERGWLAHPLFRTWQRRLLDAGASPWPAQEHDDGMVHPQVLTPQDRMALGRWLSALQEHSYTSGEPLEQWGLPMLAVPPPAGIRLDPDVWTTTSRLENPAAALRLLGGHRLSPFANNGMLWPAGFHSQSGLLQTNWARWGGAIEDLHRQGLVEPPTPEWTTQALGSWCSRWRQETAKLQGCSRETETYRQARDAWAGGWRFLCRNLHRDGMEKAVTAVALAIERSPFWSHPDFMVEALAAFAEGGHLPAALVAQPLLFHHLLIEPRFASLLDEAFQGPKGPDLRRCLWMAVAKGWRAGDAQRFQSSVSLLDAWSQGVEPAHRVEALRTVLHSQYTDSPWLARHLITLGDGPDESTSDEQHHAMLFAWRSGHEGHEGNGLPLKDLTDVGWNPQRARKNGKGVLTHYAVSVNLIDRTRTHVTFLAQAGLGDVEELLSVPASEWKDPDMKQHAVSSVRACLIGQALDEVAVPTPGRRKARL